MWICVFICLCLPSQAASIRETEPNVCLWFLTRYLRLSGSMSTFDVLPNSRIIMQENRLRFLVKHLLLGVNHRKLEKKGFPCYQNRETEGAAELRKKCICFAFISYISLHNIYCTNINIPCVYRLLKIF